MCRLLQIELFKLKNSKYFWWLSGLFFMFLISVPTSAKVLMSWAADHVTGEFPIRLDMIPIFDFVDIWQNLTWVYKSFSIFLGFIVVISTCNEFNYGTVKQNIIDGLSRKEFLLSKLTFIVASSVVATLVVLVIGLIMGFMWSPVTEFNFIIKHIGFLGAYCLHLIAFQLLCLLVALLVKKSGIAIALLIFYSYMIEPMIIGFIRFKYEMPTLSELLPVDAIGNVIRFPFGKYAMQETQTFVSFTDLGILLIYLIGMTFLAMRWIHKKDLA